MKMEKARPISNKWLEESCREEFKKNGDVYAALAGDEEAIRKMEEDNEE